MTRPYAAAALGLATLLMLSACGGGGGDGGDGGGGGAETQLYIGYYQEDPANNPEDPTLGAVMFNVPAGDGAFSGQMPFSYAGCSTGVDLGVISGTRSAAALNGTWSGSLDATAVGGGFAGAYDAAADSFSGSFTNSAGKVAVTVGACSYFVAAVGSFKVWGSATSEPAGFTLTATDTTTPTLSWTPLGAGVLYTVRVFDHACLLADARDSACFLGESATTGVSAAFPAAFPGAVALTLGRDTLAVVTGQTLASGAFAGFTSRRFTPSTAAGGGGGGGGGAGAGASGTLTVAGGAAAASAGSFVADPIALSAGSSVIDTGPTCSGSGTSLRCTSLRVIGWGEFSGSGGAMTEALGLSLISSSSSAPGDAPGVGVNGLVLTYDPDASVNHDDYALTCLPGLPCGSLADAGISVDTLARRVTFTNVVVPAGGGRSGSTTLNGTLAY